MNERIGIALPSPILPYLSDLYFKIVALPKPDQICRGVGGGIGFDFVKREATMLTTNVWSTFIYSLEDPLPFIQ